MKKKKIIAGVVILAVLAAGAGFYLKGQSGAAGGAGGQGGAGGAGGPGGQGGMQQVEASTVVKAAAPTVGDLSLTTGLTGTVEAADVVYVYAKASGDVTSVNVKAGDTVKAGQVICEIDTEQVDTAKNSMDSAAVSLSKAQSDLSRMQILHSSGDLSDQEYEQYTNSVKTAQLQYDSAKLNYDKQVDYSTVTAPIGGRVESCDVEVYDRVSQSAQLCVISGEGQNRIVFYVTQRMMNNLSVGDSLQVIKNGVTSEGTISEISSMVDSTTGLFKVKADVPESESIAIGSTVKINLVTEKATDAMLVPVDAIYYSGGDAYVYLDQDGIAKMTTVEVGLYDNEYAEILSGLNAADIVVSTWSNNLYEGAKIRQQGEAEESSENQGNQGALTGDAAAQGEAVDAAAQGEAVDAAESVPADAAAGGEAQGTQAGDTQAAAGHQAKQAQ